MRNRIRNGLLISAGAIGLVGVALWSRGSPQSEEEAWIRERYNAKVTYDAVPKVWARVPPPNPSPHGDLPPEQQRVRELFPELDHSAKAPQRKTPSSSGKTP